MSTAVDLARPADYSEPDWEGASAETLAHLQALLRFRTVNPPGDELPLAKYLQATLEAAGIPCMMFETALGRGVLVARLRGDGSQRPVLLMAHMDVVPVEASEWSVDPFGGEVREGYVYGRGAIDDKGMLAVNLETMLLLKRQVMDAGGTLARDVVFLATSDEEASGKYGLGWLIEHHPELLDAEFALNEGGRIRIVNGRPLYVAIQNSEKVPHAVLVTARGPGGHAAVPLAGNAVLRLGRALSRLGAHREPLQLTTTTREFFGRLSTVWPDRRLASAMRDVVSGNARRVRRGSSVLSRVPVLDALLRAGVSATVLSGGGKSNVIPTHASATLNIRTLPGQSLDAVVARLRRAIDDPLVEVDVVACGEDAPVSDLGTPLFLALRESVRALDPALVVLPYLSTGATDSAPLRRLGMPAYGVLPFPLTQDDEERMHGNDERLALTSLDFGVRMVYGAIARVACHTLPLTPHASSTEAG